MRRHQIPILIVARFLSRLPRYSLADVMDVCEAAWNRFATNHGLIRSLCAVAWAPASPAL